MCSTQLNRADRQPKTQTSFSCLSEVEVEEWRLILVWVRDCEGWSWHCRSVCVHSKRSEWVCGWYDTFLEKIKIDLLLTPEPKRSIMKSRQGALAQAGLDSYLSMGCNSPFHGHEGKTWTGRDNRFHFIWSVQYDWSIGHQRSTFWRKNVLFEIFERARSGIVLNRGVYFHSHFRFLIREWDRTCSQYHYHRSSGVLGVGAVSDIVLPGDSFRRCYLHLRWQSTERLDRVRIQYGHSTEKLDISQIFIGISKRTYQVFMLHDTCPFFLPPFFFVPRKIEIERKNMLYRNWAVKKYCRESGRDLIFFKTGSDDTPIIWRKVPA